MSNLPDGLDEALQRCAEEPIHLLGQIQAYGAVLSLDDNLNILQRSDNALDFFRLNGTEVLGKPLSFLLGENNVRRLSALITAPMFGRNQTLGGQSVELSLWVESTPEPSHVIAHLHRSDDVIVAEFAHSSEIRLRDVQDRLIQPLYKGLKALDRLENFSDYIQTVVEQIRKITGYDRVLMYRFDNHWDGEVIAESHVDDLETLLGQRFPASDIPAQARKLYAKNPFRLLADTELEPCSITPVCNPLTSKPLDLSFAVLRSFSPVHIQYLRNMGARASMSISVLQNGRLYGLIACHHRQAKYLDFQIRSVADFVCTQVANKLSELENQERRAFQAQSRKIVFSISNHTLAIAEPIKPLPHLLERELLDMMQSNGMLICSNKHTLRLGDLVPEPLLTALLRHLKAKPIAEVYYSECLSAEIPDFADYSHIASGMLVAPLTKDMAEFVAWFRPEEVATIRWAGQPKVPELDEANRFRLNPRQSFADWVEKRRGHAKAWSSIEIAEAYDMALSIIVAFSGWAHGSK